MAKPQCSPERSVAIVGMACVFPGAHSPEELWENVLAGRRYFRKAPPERLPPSISILIPIRGTSPIATSMAVITGWEFDPLKFHIPPVTFRSSDLAHWLALHVADAAVHQSGIDLEPFDRSRAGVILGNTLAGEFSRSHYLRLRWPYVERCIRRVLVEGGLSAQQITSVLAAIQQVHSAPLPESSEDTLAGNMANTIAGRVSGRP